MLDVVVTPQQPQTRQGHDCQLPGTVLGLRDGKFYSLLSVIKAAAAGLGSSRDAD